jgi:hypothetical protein
MSAPMFLVPTFDPRTLQCTTVAVSAPDECAAVWVALHRSPSLRYTGGTIERVVVNPEMSVAFDPWADRHRPARQKEGVR